jgi:hypothetical protein
MGRALTSPSFIKGVKRGVGYGADALTAMAYIDPELAPFAAGAQGASAYMGRGMYNPVKHGVNDLIRGGRSSVPTMMSVPDETGSLVVSHMERVADIIAPADDKFHVQSFTVQAGLEETFPWLHQLAGCYEEYEVLQCVFEYKGHDIVGTTTGLDLQGQVIAATKYNVKSKSFTDRHEMQAYPHATSCSMNGTLASGVEAAPGKIAAGDTHRYIRTGGLSTTDDSTDFDHARFELALNNTPSDLYNKEVGQLFVQYMVKLSKPKIHAGRGKSISTYRQFADSGGGYLNNTSPFGVNFVHADQAKVASRNSLKMLYSYSSNSATWTFPRNANGRYRCRFVVQGTNMDSGFGDFMNNLGAQFVVAGEVTKVSEFIGPSAFATGEYLATEDAQTHSIFEADIVVRPQNGAVVNTISFPTMTFSSASDGVLRSSVTIAEVNDFDNALGMPEAIGITDGTLKVLA